MFGLSLGLKPCCLLMWAEVPEAFFAKRASRDPVNRRSLGLLVLALALCAGQPSAASTWPAWAAQLQGGTVPEGSSGF